MPRVPASRRQPDAAKNQAPPFAGRLMRPRPGTPRINPYRVQDRSPGRGEPQGTVSGTPLDAPTPRGYRRGEVTSPDSDGYVWMIPSPTAWPNVLPDGHAGRPPGPRTQVVGYNVKTRTVRTVFRNGTPWEYHEVPPEVWERLRRTASTGRFINRVLNGFPYGKASFEPPI